MWEGGRRRIGQVPQSSLGKRRVGGEAVLTALSSVYSRKPVCRANRALSGSSARVLHSKLVGKAKCVLRTGKCGGNVRSLCGHELHGAGFYWSAETVVFKSVFFHCAGFEQIAAIDNQRSAHHSVNARPIELAEFRPFCEDQQGVRISRYFIRLPAVANLRENC